MVDGFAFSGIMIIKRWGGGFSLKSISKGVKMNAIQVLVNKSHGQNQAHVLAQSGNLFIPVNDNLVPLSEFIKTRCDMPDDVKDVFNPETTEDWGENWEYLTGREVMVCIYNGEKYDSIHTNEHGEIVGIHTDATQNEKGEWVI